MSVWWRCRRRWVVGRRYQRWWSHREVHDLFYLVELHRVLQQSPGRVEQAYPLLVDRVLTRDGEPGLLQGLPEQEESQILLDREVPGRCGLYGSHARGHPDLVVQVHDPTLLHFASELLALKFSVVWVHNVDDGSRGQGS